MGYIPPGHAPIQWYERPGILLVLVYAVALGISALVTWLACRKERLPDSTDGA